MSALEKFSQAELLASLPEWERLKLLEGLTPDQCDTLCWDWRFWARPKQLPPSGDWATWVVLAGRGFGKTRLGAGWVQERALEHAGRWIALVARNPAEARDYMIEGPGGILRNASPKVRPNYESSKKRLTWPNGSWATIYSDEEPDQLRGYSGDTAWIDEFAKFKNAKAGWDNLQFGMREASGDRPRRLITTTPRPIPQLRVILDMPSTVKVVGSSYENQANLDPTWFAETITAYEGTRTGRQEIHAEILEDTPGALWTRAMLDEARLDSRGILLTKAPPLKRIVVAVDPSGTKGENQDDGDSIGIIAAGIGEDGLGYILEDATCKLSPAGWGKRAVDLYRAHNADRIIGETNYGGAMVEHVIRTIDQRVPYRAVTASRGKILRAEPVAALYERDQVKHVKSFPRLEDQMIKFTPEGYTGSGSPDAADAAVWAITDLMLKSEPPRAVSGTFSRN